MSDLPAPFVPADVDLRDMPLPRDFLIRIAVGELGAPDNDETRRIVNEICDRMEAEGRDGSP